MQEEAKDIYLKIIQNTINKLRKDFKARGLKRGVRYLRILRQRWVDYLADSLNLDYDPELKPIELAESAPLSTLSPTEPNSDKENQEDTNLEPGKKPILLHPEPTKSCADSTISVKSQRSGTLLSTTTNNTAEHFDEYIISDLELINFRGDSTNLRGKLKGGVAHLNDRDYVFGDTTFAFEMVQSSSGD